MARWSRSTRPAGRISACSRSDWATGRLGGLVYQAFDLLYLDGRSLLDVPLEDRKRLLQSVLRPHPRVRFAAHVVGEGVAFYEAARAQGLEGVIAKLRRSPYEPGRRSTAWLKIKIRPEQELVVGGWTPGEGRRRDLGALVVGVYEDGRLRFAGKVGSGFDGRTRRLVRERLAKLEIDEPPFDPPPPRDYRGRWGGDLRDIHWVRPELVIRAELGGWSRDGMVRQAAFKGIEEGATRRPSRANARSRRPRPFGRPRRCSARTESRRGRERPPKEPRQGEPRSPRGPRRLGPGSDAGRARGARSVGQGGDLAGRRPRPEAHQPRQGPVRRGPGRSPSAS